MWIITSHVNLHSQKFAVESKMQDRYQELKLEAISNECQDRWEEGYWISNIFFIIIECCVFSLNIVLLVECDDKYYGIEMLKPPLHCAVTALCAEIIYFTFFVFCWIYNLRAGVMFVKVLYHLLAIFVTIFLLIYLLPPTVERLENIAFTNWRIDSQYLEFQMNNGCEGLLANNDNCTVCCDDFFRNEFQIKIDYIKALTISNLVLLILGFCTHTLPSWLIQFICS